MRILFFIDGLYPGGKERRFIALLKRLCVDRLAEAEVAMLSTEIRYPEYTALHVPTHFLLRRTRKDPKVLGDLYGICRKFRPDIVHTWDSMTSVYAAAVRTVSRFKLVNGMITHAPEKIRFDAWVRSRVTFPLSDAVVANSRAGLNVYHVPDKKSYCIYNGFDDSRLRDMSPPDGIRKELGIQTRTVVCMVGEFAQRKDFETYILAAQSVLERRDDVTFLAVGDGETLPRCKSLVRPEFSGRIIFTGWRSDVESIVNMIDVGVLATFTEGISNSILEYMALGKPVVATEGGGTKEIVSSDETGYLVAPRDAGALADAIIRLVDDSVKSRKMGEQGRRVVQEKFSIASMVQHYLDLYSTLLAKGSSNEEKGL